MLLSAAFAAASRPPAEVHVNPSRLNIDFWYGGATLVIQGCVPARAEPILVIRGSEAEEVFNTKSRVGPLWISSGKLHVSGVPAVFFVLSRSGLERLLIPEELSVHRLSFEALKRSLRYRLEGPPLADEIIREHFVQMKEAQGLYRVYRFPIHVERSGEDSAAFWLEFPWPKTVPVGQYRVQLLSCENGRVTAEAETVLELQRVGFVAWLGSLAQSSSILYGLLAVFLAMGSGLTIDFLISRIFGRPSRPH